MNNLVALEGELLDFKKFTEKVASAKISVKENVNGKDIENIFFVTVFSAMMPKFEDVGVGSLIKVEGRLKNSSFEKNGQKIIRMEIVCHGISVLKAKSGHQKTPKLTYTDPYNKYAQNQEEYPF